MMKEMRWWLSSHYGNIGTLTLIDYKSLVFDPLYIPCSCKNQSQKANDKFNDYRDQKDWFTFVSKK